MRISFKAWTRAKGLDDEYVLFVICILTFIDGFYFSLFFFIFLYFSLIFENISRFDRERNRNVSDGHHECVLKLVTR